MGWPESIYRTSIAICCCVLLCVVARGCTDASIAESKYKAERDKAFYQPGITATRELTRHSEIQRCLAH